jgi:hypothetical protein
MLLYSLVLYFNMGRRSKERLQRAHSVRFIAGVRRREHIYDLRERLGYVRLDLRRRMRYHTFIFKLFLTRVLDYLYPGFIFFSNVHSYRTRNSNILLISMHVSCVRSHDIVVFCHCLWALERR